MSTNTKSLKRSLEDAAASDAKRQKTAETSDSAQSAVPVFVNGLKIGGDTVSTEEIDDKTLSFALYQRVRPERRSDTFPPAADPKVVELLDNYEKEWNIQIPGDLKTLTAWEGVREAIFRVFPTNNSYVTPGEKKFTSSTTPMQWVLLKPSDATPTQYLVRIMDENQGCCYWYAGWNDGDTTCRVFVSDHYVVKLDGKLPAGIQLDLTAPSLYVFFVKYAARGMAWHRQV